MSGFFGIFNRNGKAVEKNIVDDMLEAMSYWDPDEKDVWMDGPVALGHAMLWNTPESKYEHLPLQEDVTVLTMDARIDNREELAKEIELPDRPMTEIGDSEFILGAYRKWGEECPQYLLGDFTFAIWDEEKKQLFCSRDHVGVKQFYYYIDDNYFIFSNDIENLLFHPKVPQFFNKNTIASFLKNDSVIRVRETFFSSIEKLPPASSLCINNSIKKEKKYWRIEESKSIEYASSEEYIIKLRELFEQAVEARVRTNFPIASHLSGGIDSSPIAVLAARKLKKINKQIDAYNWITPPNKEYDYEIEAWSFSREIAKQEENINHIEFSITPEFIAKEYEKYDVFTKGTMQYWEEKYIQESMRISNTRTLLSGWGGDELITYNGYTFIAGLFSQGKIISGLRQLIDVKKYYDMKWNSFARFTFRQILQYKSLNSLRHIYKDSPSKKYNKFLTKQFANFMLKHKDKDVAWNTVGIHKRQIFLYNHGHLQERMESWALSAFAKRFEYRFPLLDKRIIEFAVGVPEKLYFPYKGKERPLIKNAIYDLLPPHILWCNKPDENKVNESLKKRYIKVYEILRERYIRTKCINSNNSYVDCYQIKTMLDNFHFETTDTDKWGNLHTAYLLLSSLKNVKTWYNIIKKED